MLHVPQNNIANDGLVLYFDAGIKGSYPGSGTTWADLAGSNDGTLTNGPVYTSTNGGGIDFDGNNDVVNVTDNASLQLTGAMTIEAWWQGKGDETADAGVGKLGNSGQRGYLLALGSTTFGPNSGRFFIAPDSTSVVNIVVDTIFPPTELHHIVGTYEPSTALKLYKNGSQVGQKTTSIPASQYSSNGLSLQVGGRGDGLYLFDGQIYQVRMYNRALSAAEITQNFEATRGRFGI